MSLETKQAASLKRASLFRQEYLHNSAVLIRYRLVVYIWCGLRKWFLHKPIANGSGLGSDKSYRLDYR